MFTITHDGDDITNNVTTDSISILDARNSERDSFVFTVEKTPDVTFVPELNKEVIVVLDSQRIYGGVVINYSSQILEAPNLTYTIECSDFTHTLDSKLVTERFISETGDFIISELFADYAPAGFTMTAVSAPATIAAISFNRLTFSQCLDKLARLLNYSWYIDYNKNLHFFAQNAEAAPFNIEDGDGNHINTSLFLRKDISQLRNSIVVEGGDAPTAERTTVAAGDGESTEFSTNFKFATLPVVTVDGVAQTVGKEFIDSTLGGFDCYWSFTQKYVRFETAPPVPSSGTTNVDMTGAPLIPVVAKVPLPSSINKFGLFEYSITDPTLQNSQLAIERAIAELEAHAQENDEGRFETYRAGLRSGQLINVNSVAHGVDELYVIQRVEFRPYPSGSSVAGIWSVELQSTATMTLVQLLQRMLLDEKLEDDEVQTLLTYLTFTDSARASDIIEEIVRYNEPYNWDDVGVDWGYFKWA